MSFPVITAKLNNLFGNFEDTAPQDDQVAQKIYNNFSRQILSLIANTELKLKDLYVPRSRSSRFASFFSRNSTGGRKKKGKRSLKRRRSTRRR